ncbi:Kinesin-like protein KIN-8B [Ranunculus cassubicifolius]
MVVAEVPKLASAAEYFFKMRVEGKRFRPTDVYKKSISSTIAGVIQGLNATVFAYGSTGSGKTYTMVGTQDDPGLMVLSLHTIFDLINSDDSSDSFEVTCSYLVSILEVYMVMFYIFKFLKY